MIIYNKLKHMIDTKALKKRKENMSRNYGICPREQEVESLEMSMTLVPLYIRWY